MTKRKISDIVKHYKQDFGLGVILDEKCICYTSDQITEDPTVYTVFWTKIEEVKKHFDAELEEA
jgi:hypothetical protein